MAKSMAWGYVRIIVGTIGGGAIGFYLMHRLENSYQEKWEQGLKNYEQELLRKKEKANQDTRSKSSNSGGHKIGQTSFLFMHGVFFPTLRESSMNLRIKTYCVCIWLCDIAGKREIAQQS